ncbi:MAG TPA: TlpA disulfide reductase family protein [Devosiaceae bacterium]
MFENLKEALKNLNPRTVAGGVLALAALGIAGGVWLSNGGSGEASSCPIQAEAKAAIDAAAQGELAAVRATADGRGYADLPFQDDTGRPMTLKDFGGKTLLVNFWATWCEPCRKEMPALDALNAKYGGENFAVVPINLDLGASGIEKAQAFFQNEDLHNLPLYADPTFADFDRLKSSGVALGLPTSLLLDGDGCELGVLEGPADWDTPDGHKLIETLIGLNKA